MFRSLKKLSGSSESPSHRTILGTELLGSRIVPAKLQPIGSAGMYDEIAIVGNQYNDVVRVDYGVDAQGGVDKSVIVVTQNGGVQRFANTRIARVAFPGGDGNDSYLNSTSINDLVYGGNGNDCLISMGIAELHGGAGDDYLFAYGAGNDLLFGDEGNDSLVGNAGNDRFYGGLGNDYLYGGDGSDTLVGGSGNDHLFGFGGNDFLYGGDGSDYLSGGDNNDYLDGGADNCRDELWGGNLGMTWERGDTFVQYIGKPLSVDQQDVFADFSSLDGDQIVYVQLETITGGSSLWNN